jgi:pimeloyl-ACP methyl ester carboxylesterase
MAKNAEKFIDALKIKEVDILGFSMGGSIAQQVLLDRPDLVRKAILVGTAPQGYTNEGGKELPAVMEEAFKKAAEAKTHPKAFLFFTQTSEGQTAASAFLKRISNHTVDAEKPTSEATTNAQAVAIVTWGKMPSNLTALEKVKQPVLLVNGSNDVMAPTSMSFELFKHFPNAQLSLYPDSGHGALFQYNELFTSQVDTFLDGVN